MLWTVAVVLLVLWALGLVTSYTMGGFIHILLVVAIVVVLINVIPVVQGKADGQHPCLGRRGGDSGRRGPASCTPEELRRRG
ncbi:MAG: hypothetical protein B7Z62_05220 [Deltaproteobacteria bacterium 37-65-8]|nr:MAG: hypothetical protein B7Z62_05220 [Deltaproteobacteria bacterium 37-65-8]